MSAWDELVTTALLGTDRRPLPAALPPAVGRLAAAQPDPALAVLDAAAGYVGYLQAGARLRARPAPDPAPRQVLDPAPEPAQQLLQVLLRSRDTALVEEWLTVCTARGWGVRAGLWAALVTAAAAPRGPDRALVRRALGRRGLAFAELNPAWTAVARAPRTPAGTGSPEGPPVSLERTERSVAAVRVTRVRGRLSVLVEPPSGGPGLRALVAGVDLGAWQAHTGLGPGPFLDLLRDAGAGAVPELVAGLGDAAVAQQHTGWAAALVRAGHLTASLAAVVPADELDRIPASWVDGGDPDRAARLLVVLPGPWGVRTAGSATALLASGRLDPAASRRLAAALARRAPLTARDDLQRLAAALERDGGPSRAQPEALLDALRVMSVRADIAQAFQTSGTTQEQQ